MGFTVLILHALNFGKGNANEKTLEKCKYLYENIEVVCGAWLLEDGDHVFPFASFYT